MSGLFSMAYSLLYAYGIVIADGFNQPPVVSNQPIRSMGFHWGIVASISLRPFKGVYNALYAIDRYVIGYEKINYI